MSPTPLVSGVEKGAADSINQQQPVTESIVPTYLSFHKNPKGQGFKELLSRLANVETWGVPPKGDTGTPSKRVQKLLTPLLHAWPYASLPSGCS